MLESEELYVVLKLTTGEQVMAVLSEEDEEYIMLDSPMCIKTIPSLQTGREHVTAAPLCQFTADTTYVIAKKDIMFIKKLHNLFIPHYKKIVSEHHEMEMFHPKDEHDLEWDDESMSPEEARKRMAMLQNIAEEEPEEKESLINFVPGNDTIN